MWCMRGDAAVGDDDGTGAGFVGGQDAGDAALTVGDKQDAGGLASVARLR